jgi:DNA-binding transcriptional LysR family regulator
MVAWPGTGDQLRLEKTLADAGAQPRIVFRSAGSETIVSIVRSGAGLAVLPWLAIHHVVCRSCGEIHGPEGWPDLLVHEHVPTPTRAIHLYWPPGHGGRSPLAARAVEVAAVVSRELAREAPSVRS